MSSLLGQLKQTLAHGRKDILVVPPIPATLQDDPPDEESPFLYPLERKRVGDTMIVGFEKVSEVDDFAARVRKVPVEVKGS